MRAFVKISIGVLFMIGVAACSNKEGDSDKEEEKEEIMTEAIPAVDFPKQFLSGNYERIYNQFSESFKNEVSLEEFIGIGEQFNDAVESYALVSEMSLPEVVEYQWISEKDKKGIRAYFSEDLTIEGLQVLNITANLESDEVYTKNTYHMPINEPWFTFWGGTNELVNYHYAHEPQRYAYDLLMKEGDSTFEGDSTANESYFAFGKDVVAPLEGVVVSVENGVAENTPGVDTNTDQPAGNHVIIEHENNEYSVLGHFKKDSVVVKEGQEVKAGELLGLAGNSGNSSEPHIHFHVADSAEWENATSLRIKLNVEEPIRGEVVEGF